MKSKKVRAYWFGDVLGYGDGRVPKRWITHKVKGTPVLCSHGLHASVHPADAIQYANTSSLWLVELSGIVIHGRDKAAANRRKYIKQIDATKVLYAYARWCASRCLKHWKVDPPMVVVKYLQTGDEKLRSAAESAAESAARSAARSAAESAARSAAWSAAWGAAWSAAESAAESAARSAAWSAAESAAWSAAWGAAWGAERKAQRRKFKQLVEDAFNEQ